MAREIKFRSWDGKSWYNFNLLSDENPIMQYTGLKDRNDVEIYEDDIVQNATGQVARVQMGQYEHYFEDQVSPAYGVYFTGDDGFFFSEHLKENGKVDVEVIGNVYENSELLKV